MKLYEICYILCRNECVNQICC